MRPVRRESETERYRLQLDPPVAHHWREEDLWCEYFMEERTRRRHKDRREHCDRNVMVATLPNSPWSFPIEVAAALSHRDRGEHCDHVTLATLSVVVVVVVVAAPRSGARCQ